jgi:hypothetical protein
LIFTYQSLSDELESSSPKDISPSHFKTYIAPPCVIRTYPVYSIKHATAETMAGLITAAFPLSASGGDMTIFAAIIGAFLILIVLLDAFETIVLPRRVTRRFRLTRLFYRRTWHIWKKVTVVLFPVKRQETFLSFFGPISLILLLSLWAAVLITGFTLLHWANGSALTAGVGPSGFYLSSTTFFTLGLGDVTPGNLPARVFTAVEAGLGFGFLALVIGYLPALNQSFSRREVSISLLDARAGSPPTASEMLRRHSHERGLEALRMLLHDWERWSAEFLESHLSYPVLAFFRSQHDNQSWLASLTVILDTCALIMAGLEGACERQAELTFAMARHAVVDLSQVFLAKPHAPVHDRLPSDRLEELRSVVAGSGLKLRQGSEAEQRLKDLRRMYEPYINSLSIYLRMAIPPWLSSASRRDNWQTSAWERRSGTSGRVATEEDETDEHF